MLNILAMVFFLIGGYFAYMQKFFITSMAVVLGATILFIRHKSMSQNDYDVLEELEEDGDL